MKDPIMIIKADGTREPFNPNKIVTSLDRIGIQGKTADRLISKLEKELYQNITTKKIYKMLHSDIRSIQPEVSHKFQLKKALFDMGPAGYYFEDFTARLLKAEGFKTQVRKKLKGKAVWHEIDVIAEKKKRYMVECKFHNSPGIKCSIQTILYVHARFLDLKKYKFDNPWLITNTKLSNDVVRYAESYGIPVLAWKHPFRESLEVRIDKTKCYPITVLPIKKHDAYKLMAAGIISLLDLPKKAETLSNKTGIDLRTCSKIMDEYRLAATA